MKTSKAIMSRVPSGFQMFLALTTTLWFVLALHSFKSMPGIKRFYNKRPLSCSSTKSMLPDGLDMFICAPHQTHNMNMSVKLAGFSDTLLITTDCSLPGGKVQLRLLLAHLSCFIPNSVGYKRLL